MSANLMRGECRKFVPNIFNKTKCSNCFRQKEEHSAEALESNRASRKISKCGYLFVAPGWDFSNPLNRTKRWQRRWFVLYDDGELSYSVDEHPETIPQASIDMNKVLEVSDAEDATGNSYSIAITTAEVVHFVKGTCREEAKWWRDVLSVFLRNKGRHKRNATFSGSQTTSILQQTRGAASETRPRFNSCHTDTSVLLRPLTSSQWLHVEEEEIFPTRDIELTPDSQPVSSSSPPTRDKIKTEEKSRTRRTLRGSRTPDEDQAVDEVIDNDDVRDENNDGDVARRILFETEKSKREEKLKDIADSLTRPRLRRHTQSILSNYERSRGNSQVIKPTRDGDNDDDKNRSVSPAVRSSTDSTDGSTEKQIRGDPDGCGLDLTLQRYSPSSELRVDLPAEDLLNIKKGWLMKQCSAVSSQEWSKHWFVLRGAALMYYRDPAAEDKGLLDGVIDLTSVSSVCELQVQRNYGFQTVSWDDRRHVLSAVTAGIRNNWMSAIRRAVGIPDKDTSTRDDRLQYFDNNHTPSRTHLSGVQCSPNTQYLESGLQRSPSSQYLEVRPPRSPSSHYVESLLQNSVIDSGSITRSSSSSYIETGLKRSGSGQSLTSSHRLLHMSPPGDDFRTNSESSEAHWNETPTPLPPSPPLNRTPISRVKERAKTQTSRSRVYNKRSKSSPPSSRRNTLEISRTEEVEQQTQQQAGEDRTRSVILTSVDRHMKEIDDLKGQLNMALCERSSVEKELVRLRQRKNETSVQMEELYKTLKITEEELKARRKELEEFDLLKQRYNSLAKEHEEVVSTWRETQEWREAYQELQDKYSLDKDSWKMKLDSATSVVQETASRCEMLTRKLSEREETVEALRTELSSLSERLIRGIEENEGLYVRLQELEGRCLSSSRERGRSVDSLSDLTNIDLDIDLQGLDKDRIVEEYEELKGRFEKAIQEIRAMKRELRESHASYDDLELAVINLRQDSKRREEAYQAEASLMACRIQDLTLKLSAAEKQVRTLKQKISKSEARDKRRSLSLKGRESFQIGREVEEKLNELEAKISALETGKTFKIQSPTHDKDVGKKKDDGKSLRIRRKSLDSATSSEPMKVLIRLSSLEGKVNERMTQSGDKSAQQPQVKIEEQQNVSSSRLKDKVQECRSLLTNMKNTSRRPSSPITSRSANFVTLEKRLNEIEDLLQDYKIVDTGSNMFKLNVNCVKNIVVKLETLLGSKLKDIYKRKSELRQSGQFTREARLQLFAEKLAYESVLVRRIQQTMDKLTVDGDDVLLDYQLREVYHYMKLLNRKLKGENVLYESSFERLTKILSKSLISRGVLVCDTTQNISKHINIDDEDEFIADQQVMTLEQILQCQRDIDVLVNCYKKDKIKQLAKLLAIETMCLTAEYESGKERDNNVEDRRIREAWTLAQESLNKELVQAEISHVTMKCSAIYEQSSSNEYNTALTMSAVQNKQLEEWIDLTEINLRQVMDKTIDELTNEYENYLLQLKTDKNYKKDNLEEDAKQCRLIMENFINVIAQKVLIDSRIQILSKNYQKFEDQEVVNTKPVIKSVCLKALDVVEPSLDVEFQYLYQKFSLECLQTIGNIFTDISCNNDEDKQLVSNSLSKFQAELDELRLALDMDVCHYQSSVDDEDGWNNTCKMCDELREQITDIIKYVKLDRPCKRCDLMEDTLHKLEEQHDEELHMLRMCHEREVKDLKGELEQERDSLVCQHEAEQAELKERARRLERRLEALDAEYSQQMDNLRTAYHKTLTAELERDENTEDSIRQRYQVEIKQLRALCEKGLIAVDNSHRRIVTELEEKHRQELAQAAADKEQALAEETQATLAALDAMRKAHETEVQKEINKFKNEFLKRVQNSPDLNALHKEHEAEMEEIKQEILSLSEKYSIKCVESAALEEKLGVVNKQLTQAQQHIMQLDARNKQLRAHLLSETTNDATTTSSKMNREKDDGSTDDIYKTHGRTRQAHSLDEFRRTCHTPTREPISLDRYRHTYWTGSKGSQVYLAEKPGDKNGETERGNRLMEPTALSRADLVRCPKYNLMNLQTTSPTSFVSPTLGGQLSGMVAERKKLFEH